MAAEGRLAIDGGTPVRQMPMPSRSLIGQEEKNAAMGLFDAAIASGNAFGYGGPSEQQYEQDFAAYMGGGYVDAVNSGTNAVFAALGALRLDALSEVICPPITDCGGIMPVVLIGCVPVVSDADPRSFNTAADYIEPMISERTRAVVVAHIGGDPVDMDPVLELARKHDLYVVEDCAQSHGASYKSRRVGTMGDISAFSTMFGKHHCTGGQGGIVYTQNEELHWWGRRFADRGKPFNMEGTGGNVIAGINCNLNDLSAAIGSAQLGKLDMITGNRNRVGNAIRDALADADIGVTVGWQVPDSESSYWFLRLFFDAARFSVDKNAFCSALSAEGIPNGASYRAIPAEQPWFQNKACFGDSGFPWDCSDYNGSKTPQYRIDNAIEAVETHFRITIHEHYGDQEIENVVSAVKKVAAAYAV